MRFFFSSIVLSSAASIIHADVIYVKGDARGANDGSSWGDAFVDLQHALASAKPSDEIWVAAGTYYPTSDARRDVAFRLVSGVAMYGGFSGNETRREDRRTDVNVASLSGDIGAHNLRTDNSYHVVEAVDCDSQTIVDGLVLSGAYNDCECPNSRGGGVYIERSEIVLIDCRITENFAGGGGGVWNQDSEPTFIRCDFVENDGRGMSNTNSTPTLVECEFVNNNSPSHGAAVGCFGDGGLVAHGCRFVGNRGSWGGACYSSGSGDFWFENCIFYRNVARGHGGAMLLGAGSHTLINCTFADNYAKSTIGGFGTSSLSSVATIRNNVFWGNRAEHGPLESQNFGLRAAGTVLNNCVEGWSGQYGGVGNHGLDPQFVDFDGRDYRLTAGSPCIDAGDNGAVSEPFDLDGNPRILNGVVDMGAYESLCDDVTKIKTSCQGEPGAGKLVAKLRTTLPGGSTVMLRCDDGRSTPAAIKDNGRGKAKWNNQTGPVEVCPSGCPASCSGTDCP